MSALRQVIGKVRVGYVLTAGRSLLHPSSMIERSHDERRRESLAQN
jgi:hypothetical protein